jgi:branched-subunit amino acid ABC-type transport system permease component
MESQMTNKPPAPDASATTQGDTSEAASGGVNVRKIATVGAAIGIGSAAIAAALLYVNRPGKKK